MTPMLGVGKKLSIAFFWHMHQPVYQLNEDSDYLMPWVRLHAVKDYLDMLLILDNFKNIKLNYNLVPVLLDALIDYGEKGYHDIHSRLTVSSISDLTAEDKEFILNNFFDANYSSMIFPHTGYNELYQKRFSTENIFIEDFSDQELSDIMAWFNLTWIDPSHRKRFPEINKFYEQGENFNQQDRIEIIEIHRAIIREIIPAYKKYIEKGQIEITTSPYYHPVLPILLNAEDSQKKLSSPDSAIYKLKMEDDAKLQTKMAIDKIEKIFGKKPRGIWPSEQCVSPETLDLFKELGIDWTISDEGVLSSSIDFEFVRDFKGYLEDPYFLMKSFKYKTKHSDMNLIFRDSVIPNLISFEYSNHDPKVAAQDLYERIKIIQNKLQSSPDDHHLLTIALDGENCWENYLEDGEIFLKTIYEMIEEDSSLETVLISEYLDKEKYHKPLKKLHSGSWINKNFQLWIGEPTKNLAWDTLKQVKEDFSNFRKKNPKHQGIINAHKEIMIAQGSDWFWWFGEPNDSGQDHVFDYLFREHLKNVYRYLELEIPIQLESAIIAETSKQTRAPKSTITPKIDGVDLADEDEWINAGCISVPDAPGGHNNKLFKMVCYGADEENLYLRFYLNENFQDKNPDEPSLYQMYTYLRNGSKKQFLSNIRIANRSENIFPIMKEKFHNELRVSFINNRPFPLQLLKSIQGGLWAIANSDEMKMAFEKVVDISIPFDCIDIKKGEILEFFFTNTNYGIKESFIPQDCLLSIQRP